jgi:hypothetical protein
MKQKTLDAARAAAAPSLQPGELVELTGVASAGKLRVGKQLAQAAVVAVVTAGTLAAWTTPKKFYVVLTDRRLLFLEQHSLTGGPTTKLGLELPRAALSVQQVKVKPIMFIPTLRVDLAIAGADNGLQLIFPAVAIPEGRQFASAIG